MARPTRDTVQITFRIPTKWLAEADSVAAHLALEGRPMERTDGFRALIAGGLALHAKGTLKSVLESAPPADAMTARTE